MPTTLAFLDAALGGLTLWLAWRLLSRTPAPFPPGPKGWPLVGNIFDMPTTDNWKGFAEWGDFYGPMTYVKLLNQRMVFINSPQVAADLFDKKGANYSDRPKLIMAGEMMSYENTLGLLRFGDRHRETRKVFHHAIGTREKVCRYAELFETESRRLVRHILDTPEDLRAHIRKSTSAIILRLTYGYEVQAEDDPMVDLIEMSMEQASAASAPFAYWVDVLPILKYVPDWFPGAGWKKLAVKLRQVADDSADKPLEFVKQQLATGDVSPSVVSEVLRTKELTSEQEFTLKWAGHSMYGGGSDTTVNTIHAFFLAMTIYPEVQKRAQAELDMVIGRDRLPTLADHDDLPYVEALTREIFRWHPVVRVDLPHVPMEDDIHDGYFIPKGALVTANLWKFLHDPQTYANPERFSPELFIAGPGNAPEPDPYDFCFGFGRRICPGSKLAHASVFTAVATCLHTLNISKSVDEMGREITSEPKFIGGIIIQPAPFPCSLRPRFPGVLALILAREEL